MRYMRSFFFGSLAILATAMFMSAPATALDYEPALSSYSFEMPDVALVYLDTGSVVLASREDVPKPDANSHAFAYAVQSQPCSDWRFAVDTYSRIDPHIRGA